MLQIRLIKGGSSSDVSGGRPKSSTADNVTVACPDHLVIADLPVAKSLGAGAPSAAVVKTVGRRSRRLLGERVHFCVRCDFPIAIYGRLSPCEHAFCLACARTDSSCYLCDERIQKIQTIKMLEGIYICAAPHCLKSFLKKPEFEAHIQQSHAHLLQQPSSAAVDKDRNNNELPNSSSFPAASDALHGKPPPLQPPFPPGESQFTPAAFSPSSSSQQTLEHREDKSRRYHQFREVPAAGGPPNPSPNFYGRHPPQPLPSDPQRSNESNPRQQGFERTPPYINSGNWLPPPHQGNDYQQGLSGQYGRNPDQLADNPGISEYPLMHSHPQQQIHSFPGPPNVNNSGPPLMVPYGYQAPPYGMGLAQMPPSDPSAAAGQGLAEGYQNTMVDTKPGGPVAPVQASPFYQGNYGWIPGGGKSGPDVPSAGVTTEHSDGKGVLAPLPLPLPPPPPPLSHLNQSKFTSSGAAAVDMSREGAMSYGWHNDK